MQHRPATLKRSLGLTAAVLYGLGVTIGAGIYVLIGTASAVAGLQAPAAFILAALVMAPSAASFAEFATRLPVAAGEAAYVKAGLGSGRLALVTGLTVIAIAIIMAAAISLGSAGYLAVLLPLPQWLLVIVVMLAMGSIAAWGIVQSVAIAGLITLIEVGGLLLIVATGLVTQSGLVTRLPEISPGLDPRLWAGVLAAAPLAFFAFTGFESLANIAEEVKSPSRTLPRAILLTLLLTTLLYVGVAWVALNAATPAELGASKSPLTVVFERMTGQPGALFSIIAVIATVNGIIVNLVMASRVVYGLARQGQLPPLLAEVDARTRTPLIATALVTMAAALFALAFPIETLARFTSQLTLVVFAVVNAALIGLKRQAATAPDGAFVVPAAVPAFGLLSSLALLVSTFWN